MARAFELKGTTPDGKEASVWGCGECLMAKRDEAEARECCPVYACHACGDRMGKLDGHGTPCWVGGIAYCRPCYDLEQEAKEAARIAKAPRVLETECEMLYCECCENYFADSQELLDDHDRHERDLPNWCWAAQPVEFKLDAEDLLQGELERQEFSEETEFSAEEVAELQAALSAWCSRFGKRNFFATNEVVELQKMKEQYLLDNPREPREPVAVASAVK